MGYTFGSFNLGDMFYISQLINSAVVDSGDKRIGRLVDILIKQEQNNSYPPLAYLQITHKRKSFYLTADYVESWGKHEIILNTPQKNLRPVESEEKSLYLFHDVLDQQIIDLQGAKVVRVNDLKVSAINNLMNVVGVDVSWKGIIRRLGLTWLDIFNLFPVHLIDWKNIQNLHGHLKVETVSQKLKTLHPADLADIIEDVNIKEASRLLQTLESKSSARILEEIEPRMQKMLVKSLTSTKLKEILNRVSVDELADILQENPGQEIRQVLSKQLDKALFTKVESLLTYKENTAGGLMTNEFVDLPPQTTVREAIETIRRVSSDIRSIVFVYVVDKDQHLLGPVSVRALLLAGAEQTLEKLYKPISGLATLKTNTSVDDTIKIMTKYDLLNAAVTDENNLLLGVVTIDDVMRFVYPHA